MAARLHHSRIRTGRTEIATPGRTPDAAERTRRHGRAVPRLDEAAIEEISLRAHALGVEMDAHVSDQDIWLGQITRRTGAPGSGGRAVAMLCDLADECGARIHLAVIPWLDRVIALYRRHGFDEEAGHANADEDDLVVMARSPCRPAATVQPARAARPPRRRPPPRTAATAQPPSGILDAAERAARPPRPASPPPVDSPPAEPDQGRRTRHEGCPTA